MADCLMLCLVVSTCLQCFVANYHFGMRSIPGLLSVSCCNENISLSNRGPRDGPKKRQKLLEQIATGISDSHELEMAHLSPGIETPAQ